jgi:diguanylate cyclase (GGDEF)-like protein
VLLAPGALSGLLVAGVLLGLALGLAMGAGGVTPGTTAAAAAAVIALAAVAARNLAARVEPPSGANDARALAPEPASRGTIRDRITGLYTAAFLEDAIERDVRRARRTRRAVAVVLCDIDHFGAVDAELGADAARDVLRQVARFLEDGVRTSDVAARHGAGGFALLLADADAPHALARMEELRVRLRELAPISVDSVPLPLTMSFGVAAHPDHGESAGELLAAAQQALDAAWRLGRNRVVAARVVPR